jgi:hypothetical protein
MEEITSGAVQRLIGVLNDLAKRGIVKRGACKGTSVVEASVSGYCGHLREMAAGRGGEAGVSARERLGQPQARLAETKAAQLASELVPADEVETFWRGKLRTFRNRILAMPSRVKDLSAGQSVALTQELRGVLEELANA